MKRMRTFLLVLCLAFSAALTISGCQNNEEPKKDAPETQELRKEKKGDE